MSARRPGTARPTRLPVAVALASALDEAGFLTPTPRQLRLSADALVDNLADVDLALVPALDDGPHRGQVDRLVGAPTTVADVDHALTRFFRAA
jgi:hypothetical protein